MNALILNILLMEKWSRWLEVGVYTNKQSRLKADQGYWQAWSAKAVFDSLSFSLKIIPRIFPKLFLSERQIVKETKRREKERERRRRRLGASSSSPRCMQGPKLSSVAFSGHWQVAGLLVSRAAETGAHMGCWLYKQRINWISHCANPKSTKF